MLDKHELSINVRKILAMIFNRNLNRVNKDVQIFYKDDRLNVVSDFKYLACFLKPDLCEDIDMDKLNLSFKRNFVFLLRKFYSVDIEFFYSLFNSYCSSFYASERWVNRTKCSRNFKALSVSYHSALKKILGFLRFYSNHFTCSVLNAFTFEHYINLKCIRFLFWLFKNEGPCFILHKWYFLNMSLYKKKIDEMCVNKYNLSNILDNDFDAIFSRISFIQDREPTSMYVNLV